MILKYSMLLASHHGDLKSEGHLSRATFDSRVLHSWSRSMRCTPISHLHTIPISPHHLVMRTTNAYGIQWPTLDIAIILVIVYHLVANQFKDYTINLSLSIKVILRTSSQYKSLLEDVTLWWKRSNNFYYWLIHIYL